MSEESIYEHFTVPADVESWSQYAHDGKHVIELEGKTKRLAQLVVPIIEYGDDFVTQIPLVPAFQGAWMRVRITVELIRENKGK